MRSLDLCSSCCRVSTASRPCAAGPLCFRCHGLRFQSDAHELVYCHHVYEGSGAEEEEEDGEEDDEEA